ncbi:unnamed protein product [Sphenostylis stenocarpa]|uniref:Uncharacterized protein n=1 Tax=Sphenostylis stenocarpa TaxID=92480 RepID=A0AA86SD14_9FABA|nr:unnamed protein product [Sphenostylis stenocarpa]
MTKQKERRKESKLSSYMKAPFRFLKKARDMYVRGMIRCSAQLSNVDAAMGCPTGQLCTLPRSFSVGSATRATASDDDLKELIRAASIRSYGTRFDFGEAAAMKMKMPRSRSVGIGRIDEDKPCEFVDDVIKVRPNVYPRSKSYVTRRGGPGLF